MSVQPGSPAVRLRAFAAAALREPVLPDVTTVLDALDLVADAAHLAIRSGTFLDPHTVLACLADATGEEPETGDLRVRATRDREVRARLATTAGEPERVHNVRAAVDHDHLYLAADRTMTLGQLLDALAAQPVDALVYYEGDGADGQVPTELDSWRGVYADLALSHESAEAPTVGTLQGWLSHASGATYTGYKGGDYVMSRQTPVWVDNYGTAVLSGGIKRVTRDGPRVFLHIKRDAA